MRGLLPWCVAFTTTIGCGGSGDGPARPDLGPDGATASDAGATDAGATDTGPPVDGGACATLSLSPVAAGLMSPSCAVAPPGDDRLFICERTTGRVRILDASGTLVATPFLDVSAEFSSSGYEVGVLSLTFHPDYAAHPRVYVTYTTSTNLRVASFDVPSATAGTVTAVSEQTLLEVPLLPGMHVHSAGSLAFGADGFLYVSIGDMGSLTVSQDLNDLHGKLLRIDVDGTAPYAVPPGNPYVGMAGKRAEIFASGFREPYRFSFDSTGDLYLGEVGDMSFEEVDVLPAGNAGGQNYGWPLTEGNGHCHTPPVACTPATGTLTPPDYEYAHAGAFGDAIMGGYVYRGSALPACWQGRYFYGDYGPNFIGSFLWDAAMHATDARRHAELHPGQIVSLGLDGRGEILIIAYDGSIQRIAP